MAFIRDRWYIGAWLSEVEKGPVGRRLLGDYIVMYRGADGRANAMTGRCPHRFAPLDQGEIVGNAITCPYHGLHFDATGQCVLNPHGDGFIPPAAKLKVYPVAERNQALWIWMGDPAKADPGLLPADNFTTAPGFACQYIYLSVKANYQLVTDNLLDLTHAAFLHKSTLAGNGEDVPMPRHEFSVEGEVVNSCYYFDRSPTSMVMKTLFPDPFGRFEAKMTWRPASILELDIFQHPLPGSTAQSLHLPSTHYLTPESDTVTHYFACQARNRKIDDPQEDRLMRSWVTKAFTEEDEPMLRSCQDLMGTTDLMSLNPVLLRTDAAAVQARRIIGKLLAAETARESSR